MLSSPGYQQYNFFALKITPAPNFDSFHLFWQGEASLLVENLVTRTCFSSFFGHQMAPLASVTNLADFKLGGFLILSVVPLPLRNFIVEATTIT